MTKTTAPTAATLFSVTTITRRGAMPHTARVVATTKAAAFTAAAKVHRTERNLPASTNITSVSVQPVTNTLPKPKLAW